MRAKFTTKNNKAGGLTTETYPSLRSVLTSYDALNRPVGVSSGATTYVNSTNTKYASNDALAQLQFGPAATPIATVSVDYDQGLKTMRQQPTGVTVTTGSGQQLSLSYGYCPLGQPSCPSNNGNVQSEGIIVPGLT